MIKQATFHDNRRVELEDLVGLKVVIGKHPPNGCVSDHATISSIICYGPGTQILRGRCIFSRGKYYYYIV